ncbi:Rieske 2Fe-2S domain-containing protein [Gluconacetobacter sacchari DSM 12717]|uniref:Rieske (2Fe-2S) protein n=2 Tax=Gluconacetobacter sacchari TaxID=92759 RepID=A0A7W4NLU7_9PROT|nr:Rieske (2Fe-2S) protein [Gluconacetobacter sacchari]MBB2160167.1 Rieske (2Fe-2S) protein [Gluconacetobacter sacchari]GBQ30259.1 Rieske 2Fe-2S domain-containing protein [Gluconacetobacter sacchari DSM 12717]
MSVTREGGWYPLMLSADLETGTVAGSAVPGRDLAVWRDGQGRAHVWDDRCPHRGMRLSLGFVREGALACLYHGWRFGAEGRCVHIPAHPDLAPPGTIRTVPLPVAERHGLVWASVGAAGVQPEGDPAMEAAAWLPVRSVRIEAPWRDVARAVGMPEGRRAAVLDRDVDGRVLAALLPVGAGACMLHLLAAAPAGVERLHDLADWGRDVRSRAEERAGRACLAGIVA